MCGHYIIFSYTCKSASTRNHQHQLIIPSRKIYHVKSGVWENKCDKYLIANPITDEEKYPEVLQINSRHVMILSGMSNANSIKQSPEKMQNTFTWKSQTISKMLLDCALLKWWYALDNVKESDISHGSSPGQVKIMLLYIRLEYYVPILE